MSITVRVEVPCESEQYLETSARLRGISRTALLRRIVDTVLADQLILSVLDDEDDRRPTRVARGLVGRDMPPQTKLYRGLSAPTRQRAVQFRRRREPTKAEMYADLHAAVVNTK